MKYITKYKKAHIRENRVKNACYKKKCYYPKILNIYENRTGKTPHPSSIRFKYFFVLTR